MTPDAIRVAIVGAQAEAQWWEQQAHAVREAVLIPTRPQWAPSASALDRWDDTVRDPAVDAVCICGPLASRAKLITAALHAGKHVLAVPPIAADWESAGSMADAALDRDVILMTALPDRHRPAVARLRTWMTTGVTGDSFVLTCRAGRSSIHTQNAPSTDSLESLLARATGVASWLMGGFAEVIGLDSPAGDAAAAFFTDGRGSTAWVQVALADDTVAFEVEVTGRDGYATAHSGGQGLERATLGPRDHSAPFRETVVQSVGPDTCGTREWELFAAAIRARECRDAIEYTLALMRLFLAARRSADTGAAVVASQVSGMVAQEG
jgi:predicted dehydrogenase